MACPDSDTRRFSKPPSLRGSEVFVDDIQLVSGLRCLREDFLRRSFVLSLLGLLFLCTPPAPAASEPIDPVRPDHFSGPGLEEFRSLRAQGYEGAIDPTDVWGADRSELVEAVEAQSQSPAPTVAGDENWYDGYWSNALELDVRCAVMFQGNLIVGGYFQEAGGIPGTYRIPGWDGERRFSRR